jgi:hypothetical protein
LAGDKVKDSAGNEGSLPLRNGSEAGQWAAACISCGGGIADNEYLRATADREIRPNLNAPLVVGLRFEPFGGGRCLNAGTPDHHPCWESAGPRR